MMLFIFVVMKVVDIFPAIIILCYLGLLGRDRGLRNI